MLCGTAMSFNDTFERIFRARAVKERLAYLRSIPPGKLAILASAAFLACAAAGLIGTLTDVGLTHLMTGFCLAGLWGFSAALYIVVFSRRPQWVPLALVLQVLLSFAVTVLVTRIGRLETAVPFTDIVPLYCITALCLMLGGYGLFLWFIQTEGRFAFQAQTELALAHGIQQTLVPLIDVTLAGCEIYGVSHPSAKVGGDLVDVVALPGGHAVAYVADVAGHGLNAGILMGMLKAAARASLFDSTEPEAMFETLNRVIPDVKEASMYATCAALRLRARAGGCDIQFSLAGHPPILHFPAGGQPHRRLSDEQFPLGMLPWTGYRSQLVSAQSGDLLVTATDGVLEVAGSDGVEFGVDGLEGLVLGNAGMALPLLAQSILRTVQERGPQEDDQTLLLIRVL
jgi:Stage II sporulation protein E (SpoIIE)